MISLGINKEKNMSLVVVLLDVTQIPALLRYFSGGIGAMINIFEQYVTDKMKLSR